MATMWLHNSLVSARGKSKNYEMSRDKKLPKIERDVGKGKVRYQTKGKKKCQTVRMED